MPYGSIRQVYGENINSYNYSCLHYGTQHYKFTYAAEARLLKHNYMRLYSYLKVKK